MSRFKYFRNLSLGAKLNAGLVIAFGILLVAIWIILGRSVQNLTTQTGQQRIEQEVEVIQRRFEEAEQRLLTEAKILASKSDLIEAMVDGNANNLRSASLIGAGALNIDDVVVVDSTGVRLFDLDETYNEQEDALLSLALLGIEPTGVVVVEGDEDHLEFRLAAATPLHDEMGQIIGALIASQSVDDEFMETINLFRGDVQLALIYEGELVSHGLFVDEEHQHGLTEAESEILDPSTVEQILNGQAMVAGEFIDVGGLTHAIGYLPLVVDDETEAAMVVLVDLDKLFSFQNQLFTILFIIIGVIVLFIIGATVFFIQRSVTRPIRNLQRVAQQLGAGDLSVRAEVNSHDEIGELAQIFNQMVDQLQQSFTLTEQQSRRRIQELEVTADISRQLTTMLDVDQALQYVVNQIQRAFGYYHVHIYLADAKTGELVMREGSGDVGAHLKASGHRLQPGQGIVGQVANSAQPLLVPNVDEMSDFVRNPLLPDTRSELAVPLRKGALILGVLDMQSEELDGFDDEDLTLMQTIADQMAVVIDNARLFRQTQAAVAEAETLGRRLTLAKWSDVSGRTASGYVFTKSGITPVASASPTGDEAVWLPVMNEAITKKELSYQDSAQDSGGGNGSNQNSLSIPLMLRDQVIGVIGIERSSLADAEDETTDSSGKVSWSDDELTAIQQITEQITLALDSARLAEETRRAAWRDRLVHESTAQVWATDEIEDVMRAAVEQLGDRLRASEVVIRLGKEDDLQSE